jgi:hypothetical protein
MGYNTQFEFEFRPPEGKDRFLEALKATQATPGAFHEYEYAEGAGSAKWYEHEKEIAEASKSVPDVIIVVDGQGESQGDVWRKFFKAGKVEVHTWLPPSEPTRGF